MRKLVFGMFAVVAMMVLVVGAKANPLGDGWMDGFDKDPVTGEYLSVQEYIQTLDCVQVKVDAKALFGNNFHCGTFGGNGRCYPFFAESFPAGGDFVYNEDIGNDMSQLSKTKDKFDIIMLLQKFEADKSGKTWFLVGIVNPKEKDGTTRFYFPPTCEKCGWDGWISFSNQSGIPNGKNMQFTHVAPTKPIIKKTPYDVKIYAKVFGKKSVVTHGEDRDEIWNPKGCTEDTLVSFNYGNVDVPNSGQIAVKVTGDANTADGQKVEIATSNKNVGNIKKSGAFYNIKVDGDNMVISFPLEGFTTVKEVGMIWGDSDGNWGNGTPSGKDPNAANAVIKDGEIKSFTNGDKTARVEGNTIVVPKSQYLYVHFKGGIAWKEFGGYGEWYCIGPVAGQPPVVSYVACTECVLTFEISKKGTTGAVLSGNARSFSVDQFEFEDEAEYEISFFLNGEIDSDSPEDFNPAYQPDDYDWGNFLCDCVTNVVVCDICQ